MLFQPHVRGNIEQSAEPNCGVDHETGQVGEALAEFSLQERVQYDIQVFQVIEKIRNAVAHRFGSGFHVVFRDGYHDIPVEIVIEPVH